MTGFLLSKCKARGETVLKMGPLLDKIVGGKIVYVGMIIASIA
jgi:hypothetical protein